MINILDRKDPEQLFIRFEVLEKALNSRLPELPMHRAPSWEHPKDLPAIVAPYSLEKVKEYQGISSNWRSRFLGWEDHLSSIESLAYKIRNTLSVLNLPIAQEMAIYFGRKQAYSDLGSLSLSRVDPFIESFMLLGLGDNFSLALGDGKIVVVSRISERAALIVVTNQRIGTVFAKVREVMDQYGNELDAILQEQQIMPSKEVRAASVGTPPPSVSLEEKAPPTPTPSTPRPPIVPRPSRSVTVKTFMAPFLVEKKVLKNSSGDEKKILSLCTGRFSIEEISRKTKLPPKIVIETVYRYSQEKTLELREEKKTAEEEAIEFLKGL